MVAIDARAIIGAATTINSYTTSTVYTGVPCSGGVNRQTRTNTVTAVTTVCSTDIPVVTQTIYGPPGGRCTYDGWTTTRGPGQRTTVVCITTTNPDRPTQRPTQRPTEQRQRPSGKPRPPRALGAQDPTDTPKWDTGGSADSGQSDPSPTWTVDRPTRRPPRPPALDETTVEVTATSTANGCTSSLCQPPSTSSECPPPSTSTDPCTSSTSSACQGPSSSAGCPTRTRGGEHRPCRPPQPTSVSPACAACDAEKNRCRPSTISSSADPETTTFYTRPCPSPDPCDVCESERNRTRLSPRTDTVTATASTSTVTNIVIYSNTTTSQPNTTTVTVTSVNATTQQVTQTFTTTANSTSSPVSLNVTTAQITQTLMITPTLNSTTQAPPTVTVTSTPSSSSSSQPPPITTTQPPTTSSSRPPAVTTTVADKCQGKLNPEGRLFRMRTHVADGGLPEFDNLLVEKKDYDSRDTIPKLSSDLNRAGQFFYHAQSSSIALWHNDDQCRFSGLTMYGDNDGDAYSPVFITNSIGTHRMRYQWGAITWDNDRFDGWVVCRDGKGGNELKWADASTGLNIDYSRCSKVDLLTEALQ